MGILSCACLFAARANAILLVRVRDFDKWYLAGGKIEPGETAEAALRRELDEELSVNLRSEELRYRNTFEGSAYGRSGRVRLICFEPLIPFQPIARGEISELAWMDDTDLDKFAPAIRTLYRSWRTGHF